MLAVQTWIQSRWMDFRDDRGASLVEYALLLVLIAVVAIAAVTVVGEQVDTTFDVIGDSMSNATP